MAILLPKHDNFKRFLERYRWVRERRKRIEQQQEVKISDKQRQNKKRFEHVFKFHVLIFSDCIEGNNCTDSSSIQGSQTTTQKTGTSERKWFVCKMSRKNKSQLFQMILVELAKFFPEMGTRGAGNRALPKTYV